jgi:hypothetical protein
MEAANLPPKMEPNFDHGVSVIGYPMRILLLRWFVYEIRKIFRLAPQCRSG